jgi:hypothetical protein
VSHVAIAAALALSDVSAGERMAAFSLASFANREHRAWPGTRVAAARAGLSRSQYLAARDGLVRRGLVVVEHAGDGRGNSPVVAVTFAHAGPWFDGEINAPLFEAALSWSRARGSARLLLAALAVLADEQLAVSRLSTEELRAAGMADSTYRRARAALLVNGEVALEAAGGGRAKTNRWVLRDPRSGNPEPVLAPRGRVAPSRSARPLLATVTEPAAAGRSEPAVAPAAVANSPGSSGVSGPNPAENQTVSAGNGPGSSGVSARNPAQCRTVSRQIPPVTPPQTPPLYVRAGGEPQNPRTFPPQPPDGGNSSGQVSIVEDYITDRGRKRRRTVVVELAAIRHQLAVPSDRDIEDWQQVKVELDRIVGESTFEIWFAQVELSAVDPGGCLVLTAPAATRAWVAERFARVLDLAGQAVGRDLRIADDRERQLLDALADARRAASPVGASAAQLFPDRFRHTHRRPYDHHHTTTSRRL